MDCERAIRENLAERYLAGTLDTQTRDDWEQHFFGCEECAQQVEILQSVLPPLREMAPQIRQEMTPQKPVRRWLWIAIPVAAMAGLIIAIPSMDVMRKKAAQPAPVAVAKAPDFTLLAKLDPPAYNAPVLRGVDSPAQRQFREAMAAYQSHDWAKAIEGLQRSLELDSAAAAPRFFLGAAYLLGGNAQSASAELERVASSDSPFRDEARFDLAKAYLAQNRPDEAIASLRNCGGEFAAPANGLIARIQELRK
jgi:TolA-binding protein